jgi:hypothetical protein
MRRGPEHTFLALALCLAGLAGGPADAARLRGGIGAGFLVPYDSTVRDLYGGGPMGMAMVEFESRRPHLSLGLAAGYSRASGDLGGPGFVADAEATLTWIPLEICARFPLSGAALAPYVGAGAEVLWTRESFDYRLDGVPREAEPATLSDFGWIFVAGVDQTHSPHLRFEGFLSLVRVDRKVDRDGEAVPAGDRMEAGAVGARVAWRFP